MNFEVPIPFVETLGFELLRFGRGEAELAVTVSEALTNSRGVAHGGVTMTLLDVAMAHAARSPEEGDDGGRASVATIEMKTSFLRPAEGRLRATGKRLQRTQTMAFCEGRVHDAEGRLVAHASGTFKFVRPTEDR